MESELIKLDISDLMNCLERCNTNVPPIINAKVAYERYAKGIFDRTKSAVFQMRKYHNWVKENLLTGILKYYNVHNINLLDVAVGRGGDLLKWDNAGVSNVFGFDISEESINGIDTKNPGANARLLKFTSPKNLKNVEFHIGSIDSIKPQLQVFKKRHGLFNIVSCQFALHYFFKSQKDLTGLLKFVSSNLLPGGYFIGTCMDGDKIIAMVSDKESVSSKLLKIVRGYNPSKRITFGNNAITFSIKDTTDETNYFNTLGDSTEYLVDFKVLEKSALSHGLELYTGSDDDPRGILPFEVAYSGYKNKNLSPEEQEISFLNSAFIFKKI